MTAKPKLQRKRALRRGCTYEPMTDDHIKYVWAAYKRGLMPSIEEGLSAEEFRQKMLVWGKKVIDSGGDVMVLRGKTKWGEIPVGVCSYQVNEGEGIVRQFLPHIDWLPEASPRNKLECALKLLLDMKKEGNIVAIARETSWKFLEHICNYGVLRPVGKIRGYYADGTDAMLYQERR